MLCELHGMQAIVVCKFLARPCFGRVGLPIAQRTAARPFRMLAVRKKGAQKSHPVKGFSCTCRSIGAADGDEIRRVFRQTALKTDAERLALDPGVGNFMHFGEGLEMDDSSRF